MELMPAVFVPLALFTNFMVSLDQIPAWIRWLQWIDIFKYTIEGLAITEYEGQKNFRVGSEGGYVDGDAYLNFLGYDPDDKYFTWYMSAILFIGFRLLTWVILVAKNGF